MKKKAPVRKTAVLIVQTSTVDLDDQIVVSVDSIQQNNRWLFDTKNADYTGPVNHLWRPTADHRFYLDEHVSHTTTPKLQVDTSVKETYNGVDYYSLQAPFSHQIIGPPP